MQDKIVSHHDEDILSNLRRHGLIMFRICLILTVLRKYENGLITEPLICSETDFENAQTIIKILLEHVVSTQTKSKYKFTSSLDNELFENLKETFSRADAVKEASKLKISKRTLDDKLSRWTEKQIIEKLSQGQYKKQK